MDRWKSTCDFIPLDFKMENQGKLIELFLKRKKIISSKNIPYFS